MKYLIRKQQQQQPRQKRQKEKQESGKNISEYLLS